MSKYKELAKKIYELTKRGESGEKENAELQLRKLMEKYNFTIEDLEEDKKDWFCFKYEWDFYLSRKLLFQILYMVCPYAYYEKGDKRYEIIVECTAMEKIEIDALYAFYLEKLKEDIELFYSAYIHTNILFSKIEGEKKEQKEYTEEEMKKLEQISRMMLGMEKHTYYKQLERGEEE